MAETKDIADSPEPADNGISSERVHDVSQALGALDEARVRSLVEDLRAPDLADLIELLPAGERASFVQALGHEFDFDVLSELDETVRDQLSEELPNEYLARAVTELDSDDAAYLVESLEPEDQADVLSQLSVTDRAALLRNLEYDEETAGRLMQSDFVAVAPFWDVGQVIDYMRETEDLPDSFSEIYVVDPSFKVLGAVELSRILRSKRQTRIEDIMEIDLVTVQATDDQEEVARKFERYDLMSAPVIDDNNRLVGVVTVDDVVEVIQSEAEEDIRLLSGVGDESVLDTVLYTVRSRIIWLVVNLGAAILAATVISLFDKSIEKMVALAVLMPIVASMGGNAGTQTMTVTVRALATKDLGPVNALRVILREASVGLINGLVFAFLLGILTFVWFGSGPLGLVIAGAMIINFMVAALSGIIIPLLLERLKQDPAVASSVFVTTLTDVVGFFAFLGLATMWLL